MQRTALILIATAGRDLISPIDFSFKKTLALMNDLNNNLEVQ